MRLLNVDVDIYCHSRIQITRGNRQSEFGTRPLGAHKWRHLFSNWTVTHVFSTEQWQRRKIVKRYQTPSIEKINDQLPMLNTLNNHFIYNYLLALNYNFVRIHKLSFCWLYIVFTSVQWWGDVLGGDWSTLSQNINLAY